MTTESKLRDAADRLLQVDCGEPIADVYPDSESSTVLSDTELLCDAWLAEHPADDNEPVNEEWLRSSCGLETANKAWFQHAGVGDDVCAFFPDSGGVEIRIYTPAKSIPIRQCTTRGSFRRLCRALGVE